MQNIWPKVRNIMSKKWGFFCHRSSRFHYSLFLPCYDGFNAQQGRKELIQNRSIEAEISERFYFGDFYSSSRT